MFFWGHRFPPKNEWTNLTLLLWYLRSTCFRSSFGGNWRPKKTISKLTDLYLSALKSWHNNLFLSGVNGNKHTHKINNFHTIKQNQRRSGKLLKQNTIKQRTRFLQYIFLLASKLHLFTNGYCLLVLTRFHNEIETLHCKFTGTLRGNRSAGISNLRGLHVYPQSL